MPVLNRRTNAIEAGRWQFLDAIRGIAALLVLTDHWLKDIVVRGFPWTRQHIALGPMGVAAFFLVSGFIIPVSLEKRGSLRVFWVGRLFRLFPLYLFSVAVAFLCGHYGLLPDIARVPIVWRTVIGNVLMCQELFHVPYLLQVWWSLSFEALFYIACSVLFLFGVLRKSRMWSMLTSLVLLSATLSAGLFLHRGLSAEKAGVIITAFFGTVLYRYSVGHETRKGVVAAGMCFAAAIATAFWFRLDLFPKPEDFTIIPRFNSFGFIMAWIGGGLLFGSFWGMRGKSFPRPLCWLGEISYSLYLMHPFVIAFLKDRVSTAASGPLVLTLSLGLAYLTYSFIERPFIRWNKRLFKERSLTPPPSTSVIEPGADPVTSQGYSAQAS